MKEYEELINTLFYSFLTFLIFTFITVHSISHAKIIEKVVAVIDNEVITLTELNDAYEKALKGRIEVTKEEVLNEMIDRALLLKEAQKFLGGEKLEDHNELIKHYIDRRIRAFTRIPFEDIEHAYTENKDRYKDKKFYEVKEDIEKELIEEKVKIRLKEEKENLRNGAIIKINPFDSLLEPQWKQNK